MLLTRIKKITIHITEKKISTLKRELDKAFTTDDLLTCIAPLTMTRCLDILNNDMRKYFLNS